MAAMVEHDECSFDKSVHILTPEPDVEQTKLIAEVREKLCETSEMKLLYDAHQTWLSNDTIMRFLIARQFRLQDAVTLLTKALNWREKRKPDDCFKRPEWGTKWREFMKNESQTGKVWVSDLDRHGRTVVVFDNTVQNTQSTDDQMLFLAWSLEFALRVMKASANVVADKYCIFIHLGK
jgi:hypothetical protein